MYYIPGDGCFLSFLRDLDSWQTFKLAHFVYHAHSRLSLTGNQVSANSKNVNLVLVSLEVSNRDFVKVIACYHFNVAEVFAEEISCFSKYFLSKLRQVRQVT